MKFFILLFTLYLCSVKPASAQTDEFSTDRPRQNITINTITKKSIQLESGGFYQYQNDLDQHFSRFEHPYLSGRYGLLERVELRLSSAYETHRFRLYDYNPSKAVGVSNVQVGAKWNILTEQHPRPAVSITAHYRINNKSGKNGYLIDTTDGANFRLSFQHHFSENILLDYSAGMDWMSFNYWERYIYTISPVFLLSEKWKIYVEASGLINSHTKPSHFIRGGAGFMITDKTAIDLVAGKCWNMKYPTLREIYCTGEIAFQFAWRL